MAEPLKNMYDEPFLKQFAAKVKGAWAPFDSNGFVGKVQSEGWETLELKARIRRITESLGASLPVDYEAALDILYSIEGECTGFPYLFFPDFIEVYGRDERYWERSMDALARFTLRSSSEFAVRPFIIDHPHRMLPQLLEWAKHPSEHVRRLASEGSRPRLPWGQALPAFKRDPEPLIPILEQLKADSSLYVRKSVANNLNDIAKDHPELVIALAERWRGDNEHTDWIVRHACRTLIKRADPRVMALFGYSSHNDASEGAQLVADASLGLLHDEVAIGGETTLLYRMKVGEGTAEGERVKLRVEYGIHYVKSGGKTSLKRFLLSDREYARGELLEGERRLSFADLTTRKHYGGRHEVTLWVNGREAARGELLLTAAQDA